MLTVLLSSIALAESSKWFYSEDGTKAVIKSDQVNGLQLLDGTPIGGGGDVTGAASSIADNIVLFNGTTGKIIKDGLAALTDFVLQTDFATDSTTGVVKGDGGVHFSIDGAGQIDVSTNVHRILHRNNGTFNEPLQTTVTESTGTVFFNLEQFGGGDLTMVFSDDFSTLDCTPICAIALTAGSDTNPTLNYVYIPQSTKVLTVNTTGFSDTIDLIRVGTVLVPSATLVASDGTYKTHLWEDTPQNEFNQGQESNVNFWIRSQHATWFDGVSLTPTVTSNGGALDNLDIATAAGNVLQLHKHPFPVFDTGVASSVYVINDPTTAYDQITDLNAIIQDSAGTTLRSNNDRYNLVIWGVASNGSGDSKLFINEPIGKYNADAPAINDDNKTANYNIPDSFKGTAFLIARLTVKYTTASSGTLEILQNEDLRGTIPSIFAGGTASTVTEFDEGQFRVFDTADPTKKLAFELDNFTTATTREWHFQDSDDIVVGRDTTDILTNKTLTTPLITTNGSINLSAAGTLGIATNAGANTITIGGATSTVAIPGLLTAEGVSIGGTVASGDVDMYDATNDGNPSFNIGSSATNRGTLQAIYDSGLQTLNYFLIGTDSATEGDIVLMPNGNVGIGTNSPVTKFHTSVTGSANQTRFEVTDDRNIQLQFRNNGITKVEFGYSATDNAFKLSHAEAGAVITDNQFVVKEGNVGIGITNPASALEVFDSSDASPLVVRGNWSAEGGIGFRDSVNPGNDMGFVGIIRTDSPSASDSELILQNTKSGTLSTSLLIDTAGNVGIGTDSPDAMLHVVGSVIQHERDDGSQPVLRSYRNDSTPNNGDILLNYVGRGNNDAATEISFAAIKMFAEDITDGAEGGAFSIEVANGGSLSEAFRILSNGNVGIGITSPTHNLTIGNGATSAGFLAINEDTDDGTNNMTFTVPALAADVDYIWPPDDGDADEVLTTNGTGTLTWEAGGGGGLGVISGNKTQSGLSNFDSVTISTTFVPSYMMIVGETKDTDGSGFVSRGYRTASLQWTELLTNQSTGSGGDIIDNRVLSSDTAASRFSYLEFTSATSSIVTFTYRNDFGSSGSVDFKYIFFE